MIEGVEPTKFSQREACICINSILKTSDFYKAMPQDERGQLILFLKEKYFPDVKNDEIRQVEAGIIDMAHNKITMDLMRHATTIPLNQMKTGFDTVKKFLGKDKAKELESKIQEFRDKEHV